jgi:membrane fusion protein (multidrug efflux system)
MIILKRIKLTVIFPLLILLSACGKKENQNNSQAVQPVDVQIETVKPAKFTVSIQVSGSVKAYEDANLSPEEGGVIKEWKAKKGQHVKHGDVIAILNDDMIKAGYDAAEAQYKMAELNLEKQKEVYAQQGISELQYKNFQYTRDAAKANADLMKARWERTQIRSPFDGVVDNTFPNEGEYAPPGVPITRVVNMSQIKIQTEVPEIDAGSISVGSDAVITFDAIRELTLKGKVSFIGSTLSSANRTLMVEVTLISNHPKLKSDMMAKVKLPRETKLNALLVSENIIQLVDRDRAIVYVEKDGKAEERRLKLGARQGNKIDVLDGLKTGDRLIIAGYQKCINGTPVVVTR